MRLQHPAAAVLDRRLTLDPDIRAITAEELAGEEAWFVGGTIRDELLGRPTGDVDVVLTGDARRAARAEDASRTAWCSAPQTVPPSARVTSPATTMARARLL